MPIRVAIADDHKVLIDGLSLMLRNESEVQFVGDAQNGIQLLNLLENTAADVILLDINMRGMGGLEACKIIKKKHPDTKILALTMHDKGKMVQQMLKAGASGYLLKNTGKDELLLAIRTVASGDTYLSPKANQALLDHLRTGKKASSGSMPSITRREQQILKLISEEFTNNEIAEKLHISMNTVDTHRKNLLAKLGAKNTAGLIRISMEKGLL